MDDFFRFATMKGGGHRLELTGPIVTSRPWWSKDGEQFACSTEFDAQLKALEGEELTREYASIALGAAFHPYFVGSTFDPEAVGIEKQNICYNAC